MAPSTRKASGLDGVGVPSSSGARSAAVRRPAARAVLPTPITPGSVLFGIDPGTRVLGWGAIRIGARGSTPCFLGADVVRTPAAASLPERLGFLRDAIDRLLGDHRPDVVIVEEAFASKNVQTALRIGEGRGVVLSCAVAAGCKIVQYPPAVAKKALTGNGQAHKSQVAAMVVRLLQLSRAPEPLDATDALSLAVAHALRAVRGGISG